MQNIDDHKNSFLSQDLAIIALSVVVAVILTETGVLIKMLSSTKELELLGSFIAGMFFTSIFTVAPSVVTLGEIARSNSVILTAIFGGAGAVVGDLVIFRFIRDRFSGHIMDLVRHQGAGRRMKALLKLRSFKWLTFFVGGLIIASPLPDELGISLLGFSKMKTRWFIPLSFVFNSAGILLIGLVAKSL
ncbi:MAG: hypothetical protein WCX27_02845 [Candidatus Paceibacterota bacterium]|jgi:hypothetical protein